MLKPNWKILLLCLSLVSVGRSLQAEDNDALLVSTFFDAPYLYMSEAEFVVGLAFAPGRVVRIARLDKDTRGRLRGWTEYIYTADESFGHSRPFATIVASVEYEGDRLSAVQTAIVWVDFLQDGRTELLLERDGDSVVGVSLSTSRRGFSGDYDSEHKFDVLMNSKDPESVDLRAVGDGNWIRISQVSEAGRVSMQTTQDQSTYPPTASRYFSYGQNSGRLLAVLDQDVESPEFQPGSIRDAYFPQYYKVDNIVEPIPDIVSRIYRAILDRDLSGLE